MTEVDVAIVGAGAAGVGAARRLAGTGASCVILEAGDRVGGRAWTQRMADGPLDLGCGWLHSADRNPWVAIAEEAGFTIDRTPTAWGQQYRDLGFPRSEQAEAHAAYQAFDQRLREAPPASDRASDALLPGSPWNGFIDALSGYINGAGLAALSVADYLAYDDAATERNWRLPAGYGTLVAASLPPVPLHLACPVNAIALSDRHVELATPRGTVRARAAIVTVSTHVLTSGALTLPAAASDHVAAAAALPLGLANKLFLAIDSGSDIEADTHVIGRPRMAETGSYYLKPFGRNIVECFFGGEGASDLEAGGLDGAAAFAIDELAGLFGTSIRRRLRLVAGSAWRGADGFGGSYSHALPGHADARGKLAVPVQDRLFFVGEACSTTDFSTCHGAFQTGQAAAAATLGAIG